MMKFAKTKKTPIIVLATVLVILLSVLVLFSVVPQKDAQALTTTSSGIKVGGGAELWDSTNGNFNRTVFYDLKTRLFGTSAPLAFMQTQSLDFGSRILTASTINSKNSNTNGLIVTLGGIEWMVASATLDRNNNVICTLYAANAITTSRFRNSTTTARGANAYCRSDIRNHLLTDATYSFFRSGSFATSYLVQPKDVEYQYNESIRGRGQTNWATCLNDALGSITSGWISGGYTYTDPTEKFGGIAYNAWGEDYIWLPSFIEAGGNNICNTQSIWKLSNTQRQHTTSSSIKMSWYRTGCDNSTNAYTITADGVNTSGNVVDADPMNQITGVRPAIHFNMTAAATAIPTKADDPESMTTIYNYAAQTVKSVYDSTPALYQWYDKDVYEPVDNYIALSYYDKDGAAVSTVKDAAEYWVKAEIQSAWGTATDAEVEAERTMWNWSDAQVATAKANRKPKFDGTAQSESGQPGTENDTTRWFKFTVTPKELTVNAPSYDVVFGNLTAPTFANDGELYADAPALATRITGTADDGSKIDQINTLPTKRGNYTAQAILVKSSTDTTPYDGGNYVIKDENSMKCDVSIGYQKLPIPTVAPASQTYTGSDIKFALSGYNTAWADVADLVKPTGVDIVNEDGSWYLVAKKADEYTLTAKIKPEKNSDWCWAGPNGTEIVTDQTIKITIARKTLFVDFTSSSGSFVMQKNAAVTFGVEPSNEVEGDDVLVSLQYYNLEHPESPILVPGGKLNAAALEQGTYRLEAVLDDDLAVDNCNYVLDTESKTQDFTVSSQGINIPTVEWQYRLNNGEATAISGSGESAANPYVVTYTGGTYVFSIAMNAATLANSGVKIDGTYGTNGYQNSSQVNATDNAVAITVKFIPYSAEFAFIDENGQQAAEQFEIYTLYVKVDKASIDFTKLEWSADELEYTGKSQSVSVVSGLPSFITPTYGGASGTAIGDYTTSITKLTSTDADAAKNYIVPTDCSNIPKHEWKIIKKKIIVSWIDSEESTGDGDNVVFVPTFADNPEGVVVYTYYPAMEGDVSKPDLDKPLSVDDIVSSFDATKTATFFACAKIKDDTGSGVNTFNSTNCTLILDGQEVDVAYQSFEIGDNKNPIRVSLNTNKVVYNGQPQPPEVEVEGAGFNKDDLNITYKVKNSDGDFVDMDDPTNPEPLYAGEYKVCVSINRSVNDYAITGQKEFDYVIAKADIDLSGMKWVDTDHEDAEYTAPYTYKPGVSHKLEYVGNSLEDFDGLTMEFTSKSKTNAGKYTVTVTFTVEDEEVFNENYNVPETIEFEWEIEKYNPDLSGVKWNYNDKPFTFTIKDGEPVKQSARLIGFPEEYAEELASLIIYGNDTDEYSDIGKHTTSYSIDEDNSMRGNYGDLMFPAGLETEIDWEIHPLLVEKADNKQTKPFKVGGYTFEEITNLPEDFEEYFDVQVTDVDGQAVEQTENGWVFEDIGRYRIKIGFKDGMNKSSGGKFDNVKWSDNSRNALQITLNIEKLVFVVNGWIANDDCARPELDVDDEDIILEIEKYFDYVVKEQASGEVVPSGTRLEGGTYYSIVLKLKEEYTDNVGVKYNGSVVEETTPFLFLTSSEDDPDDFVKIPDAEKLMIKYPYTGEEIEFDLGELYDSSLMVIVGEMKGTEIGEYPVMLGFKKDTYMAWGTEDDWVAAITVTFVIYEDSNKGRFVLTDEVAENHSYKFQYENYQQYDKDISEYVYSETDVLIMSRLAYNDTLADLLTQFKNEDIKVFDAKDVEITDMSKALATGMVLRLMDGATVLNQLTISVLGDIDGDGKIGTVDKAQLNAHTLGTRKLDAAKLLAGDIDGDGKIGTVDKAQLNAYTLGSRDLYSKLTLKSGLAKSVSLQAEDVESEVTVEEKTVTVAETVEIEVEASEEVKENSEEKREDERKEAQAIVVDIKRLRVSF